MFFFYGYVFGCDSENSKAITTEFWTNGHKKEKAKTENSKGQNIKEKCVVWWSTSLWTQRCCFLYHTVIPLFQNFHLTFLVQVDWLMTREIYSTTHTLLAPFSLTHVHNFFSFTLFLYSLNPSSNRISSCKISKSCNRYIWLHDILHLSILSYKVSRTLVNQSFSKKKLESNMLFIRIEIFIISTNNLFLFISLLHWKINSITHLNL